MAVPETINTFPEDICLNKLSTKQIFPKVYYSNRVEAQYLEATITIALLNQTDIETMQKFWYSQLINLYFPFKMTLPLFGEQHEYTVRFIGDLKGSWKDGIFPKEETFTIQILDNIEAIFNQNRLDATLEMDGGSVTFVVDNDVNVDWGDGVIKQYTGGEITGVPFDYMHITSLEAVTDITFDGDFIKSIDLVKGLDLTDGDDMCKDLTYLESFTIADTPNLTSTNSMFENTPKLLYPPTAYDSLLGTGLNATSVVSASKMYKGSGIILLDMDTSNIEDFSEFLMDAVDIQCISRFNTLNATDTTDMFTNTTSLVYPDTSDRALIVLGADWENEVYCPFFVTRWLENMLYDDTNITDEFLTLSNMDTSLNKLLATGQDSVATSEPLLVSDLTKTITQIRDGDDMSFTGYFQFETLDNGSSGTNLLMTNSKLENGDNLVCVLEDDSIVEFTAANVSSHGDDNVSEITFVPTMTSNVLPSGLAFATNTQGTGYEEYRAFDGGITNGWRSETSTDFPVVLGYQTDEALFINKYMVTGDGYLENASPKDWTLEGSNDTTTGLDGTWGVLDTVTAETAWSTDEVREFTIANPDVAYTAYRLNISANNGDDQVGIEEFVIVETGTSMDTSAVTAGETPSKVYNVTTEVAFDIGTGFRVATIEDEVYTTGTSDLMTGNDPFGDGSLVARWELNQTTGDALESVGGTYNDGVNTGVVWYNDDERGYVGDFRASLSKIQTDLKTSDLSATYTIIYFARRFGYDSYDDPYTELGTYGCHAMFDGRDSVSFDSNSGGWHKGSSDGNVRVLMDQYTNMDNWNMYGYGRENGISVCSNLNGVNIAEATASFVTQTSSNPLQFGSAGTYKSDNYNGLMSDYMVFNRKLTEEEFAKIYLTQKPVLFGKISYNDVVDSVGSQTVETRVKLKNEGDSLIKLHGELHGIEETTVSTNCWSPLTELTGWYGKDDGDSITVGTIDPELTSDYTHIYSYKFNSSGVFVASFGSLGTWQLPDTNLIVFQHTAYGNVELYWDASNEYYTGTNLALATSLIGDIGKRVCFTSLAIPYDAVEYDYGTLEVEE